MSRAAFCTFSGCQSSILCVETVGNEVGNLKLVLFDVLLLQAMTHNGNKVELPEGEGVMTAPVLLLDLLLQTFSSRIIANLLSQELTPEKSRTLPSYRPQTIDNYL